MAVNLPAGFRITNVDPVDGRLIVEDQTERLSFSAANVYEGMVVYQKDTNELYVLFDTTQRTSNTGWNKISSGSVGGSDQQLQFNSGSALSGSTNLTFNYNTNQLALTGNMIISGALYANEYYTNVISASIIYRSGSTKFGDDAGDTHQFTGSIYAGIVSGTTAQFTTISGSNLTGTFSGNGANLTNLTASNINNFTNDVRSRFSAGTGIIINAGAISASNVPNSSLQNSAVALGTTVVSLGATGSIIQGLTTLTASTITGTTAQFVSITGSYSGSGAGLTNLTASNITNFTNDIRSQFNAGTGIVINAGTISASNVPNTSLQNSAIALGTTSISLGTTGSIVQGLTVLTSSNITGTTAQFTTISGSNITSSNFVGNGQNITNLTASNITNFTNDTRNQFTPGTNITIVGGVISSTGGSTIPGGVDTTIQFNSGSIFSGSTNLIYDYTNNILSGTTAKFTTISGSQITASSTLQVSGATTIGGNLNVNGGQTTVQSFTASAGISSSAGLVIGGNGRILGNLTLDNNLVVSGNTTLGNTSTDIVTSNAQITASSGVSASVIDVTDKATTRSNLGLAIGTNVQAYDATLAAMAGVTTAADRYIYFTGVDTATFGTITTLGRDIVDSSTTASAQSTLGLTVGTDVLAYDATLQAIANAPNPIADRYYYFTGVTTAVTGTITNFGRNLLADNNDSDGRATLGLGTISTQDSNNVIITGGSINGTQIGNTGQAAGKFTSLSASSIVNLASTLTVQNNATFFGDVAVSGNNITLASETPNITTTSSAGRITIGTGSNDSLIEIATPGGSTYRGIRILSGSTEKWFAGVDSSNDYVLRTDGNDRFQFFEEGRLQIIQTTNTNTSGLYFNSGTVDWYVYINSTNDLYFQYETGGNGGYIVDTAPTTQMNFTGQHRNIPDASEQVDLFLSQNEGLIVISAGTYNNVGFEPVNKPTINESLPKIKLSTSRNQKSVFGVIAEFEDPEKETREWGYGVFRTYMTKKDPQDNRIIVNAVGEGAIWVCNINGNLENGDYITTCEIPGHGMKQDDDLLHNYTVAKITQDCSFELDNPNYDCVEFEFSGSTYRKAFVGCTYHCG